MSISNADKTPNAITRDEADRQFKLLLDSAVLAHKRAKSSGIPDEVRAEAFARLQKACAALSEPVTSQ
jgi:hypothetical protein